MTDLPRQAADQFLMGLRAGYDLAKIAAGENPSPKDAANLENIQKNIAKIEAHIAKLPPDPARPVLPQVRTRPSAYDPVKAAADRAEQRSRGRKP